MSEPEEEPEEEIRIEPPKRKRRVNFQLRHAIMAVIERKKLGHAVDYKAIAARHGTSLANLRNAYYEFRRGKIDMGTPTTQEEKKLDQRIEHERMLTVIYRLKSMIRDGLEGLLFKAEDEMTKGKPAPWRTLGIPETLREIKMIQDIQAQLEKGYVSILEEDIARRMREEKRLLGTGASPMLEVMASASDEERAHRALQNGNSELPEQT